MRLTFDVRSSGLFTAGETVIIFVTTQHYNCHEKYYKYSNLILYYYVLSFWCNKGNDGKNSKNVQFASKSAPPLNRYDNN